MARKIRFSEKALQIDTHKADWYRHLGDGETLLWSGVPIYGPRFTRKGLMLSLLGALIIGYGLNQLLLDPARYITNRVSSAPTDDELAIILVGSYLLFGHMVFDAIKRKYTRYALTSKRAFIIKWGRLDRPDIYPIDPNTPTSIIEGSLDSVFFYCRIKTHKDGVDEIKIGFQHICEGRKVFDILEYIKGGEYREKA